MSESAEPQDAKDENEELLMLLAGEVLGGLDESEQKRLIELEGSASWLDEKRDSLERVASSIGLAADLVRTNSPSIDEGIPMSLNPELVSKIREQALNHLAETPVKLASVTKADPSGNPTTTVANAPAAMPAWIGWCVAAGLAFLCVGMWWTGQPNTSGTTVASVNGKADAEAWVKSHPNAIQMDWSIQNPEIVLDNATDAGRLAWDSESQTGFMTFNVLPVNDGSVQQYQLWIIDPKRDEKPIDGGVFDIVRTGESFVPINAKLKVIDPIGFAITVEKPGGVVVSDQSRLPLLAMVP